MRCASLLVTLLALAIPELAFAQPSEPAPPEDTKAVGTTPEVPTVPVASPTVEASPDIDLASLGLAPNAAAFDDKLNISGFADTEYSVLHFAKPVVADERGFASGSLNLYLAKNLTSRWRFLSEVRYLYAPNGSLDQTTGKYTNTAATDFTDFQRSVTWGGISIERAYIEYDLDEHLTIRVGRFLTPYGVWNIDHGSPAIIAAFRPFIIGERYFPEHQTGIDLSGKTFVGEYHIGYHATVSNGRSPTDANYDQDTDLAYGGRLELEAPWAGTVKLGISGYMGRYTGLPAVANSPADSYEERSYAGDVQWDHGGLHVQAELIGNERHYRDGQRARTTSGFALDGRQWGGYALVGYRTDRWWNVMPFAYAEMVQPIDGLLYDKISGYAAGLNFRPTASVALKVQGTRAQTSGDGLLDNNTITFFATQIAWAF